jgi:transmembrane 9 superfamily protein 2/4
MLKENGTCRTLCLVEDVTGEEARFINDRIREDYAINWLVDGLPAAEMKVDVRSKELFFDMGFNLGDNEGKRHNVPALNNHYEIVLRSEMFFRGSNLSNEQSGITCLHQTRIALWEFLFGLQGNIIAGNHYGSDFDKYISIGGRQTATPNCDIQRSQPLILTEDTPQPIRYTYRVMWNVSSLFFLLAPAFLNKLSGI